MFTKACRGRHMAYQLLLHVPGALVVVRASTLLHVGCCSGAGGPTCAALPPDAPVAPDVTLNASCVCKACMEQVQGWKGAVDVG